jgi:hypothetical protein
LDEGGIESGARRSVGASQPLSRGCYDERKIGRQSALS